MGRLLADQDGHLLQPLGSVIPPRVFSRRVGVGADHQAQVFHLVRRHLTGHDRVLEPAVVLTQQHLQVLEQFQQCKLRRN